MNRKQKLQLPLQTLSLVSGFMVWVILSALIPYIQEDIDLTATQVTWVTSVPVVVGALLRIPLGYWTNLFGARNVFYVCFILLCFPVYYVSLADSFADLIIGGVFLGIGGAVFSIGVTSLPKYFPSEKQGLVNGIYGAGNIGTALTTFSAPVVAEMFGWPTAVRLYLILVIGFFLLNFIFGDKEEERVKVPLMEQVKAVYLNVRMWFLSLFYFITFGSFVAFTVFLPNFLVTHFQIESVDAGFRTAVFIALATALRPVGGWLGDRYSSFKILMYVFIGLTIAAIMLAFMTSIELFTIGCLLVSVAAGIGNGVVFKLVPLYFTKQAGIVNGIVAAMGGFFPPLILTSTFNITGHYAIGFMALSQLSLASLILVIWMYYADQNKKVV